MAKCLLRLVRPIARSRWGRHGDACAGNDGRAPLFALSEAGFEEEDILLAKLIVAYFDFVNRVAPGLGVEFDADEMRGYGADR